jgi:glycosyltransferase involved in cell wall biosynthesis
MDRRETVRREDCKKRRDEPARARLRVALMIESDGPGGAENMLLHLGGELRKREHLVVPVLPADGCGWLEERFSDLGIECEQFQQRIALDPGCVTGLIGVFRRQEIDVVHSHDFKLAVYGAAATAVARRPHIITLHGSRAHEASSARRAALRWACRRSDVSLAVSEATRDRYEGSLGLPAGSISVVPNGAWLPKGDRTVLRRLLALEDHVSLLVAIGNLYAVKGYSVLVRALGQLRRERPQLAWHCAIAGRGAEERALLELAAEEGISDQFHLLGYRSDVADVLAAADVFVMPSHSEGLPLALLEAMLAGRAIVATDVGGVPEAVRDGREALLVPPAEHGPLALALQGLLDDPDLRERLAASARRRAETRYTIAAMTDEYERLYRDAIGRRRAED